MREEILSRLSALPGRIAFYYKNLADGEIISYHEQEPMMAASVIKLFILAEAFRQMEAGELEKNRLVTIRKEACVPSCGALTYMHDGLQATVEDLYTLMIILSDNTATNYMIDILGREAVNEGARSLGFCGKCMMRRNRRGGSRIILRRPRRRSYSSGWRREALSAKLRRPICCAF